MRLLGDHEGLSIRLTNERLAHILEHPEMAGMESAIEETLLRPEHVMQSPSDPEARLYYRYYSATIVGSEFVCVIVKVRPGDAFVITAYLTDRLKKGTRIWPREE